MRTGLGPRHAREAFRRDGVELALHGWAAERPRAAIFYVHGTQSHAGWLFETGPAMAERGYTLHALDRRGSGESAGPRGDIDDCEVWLDDYRAAFVEVRGRSAGIPLLLVGQSFGGSIALALAGRGGVEYDGLVLCSPLITPLRLPAQLALGADEQRVAFPVDESRYCEQPEYQAFIRKDPLRLRDATLRFHRERARLAERNGDLRLSNRPCTLVVAQEDVIIDLTETRALFERLSAGRGRIVQLPERAHYLEFSPSREALWEVLAEAAGSPQGPASQRV